jgi:hypothetical protein
VRFWFNLRFLIALLGVPAWLGVSATHARADVTDCIGQHLGAATQAQSVTQTLEQARAEVTRQEAAGPGHELAAAYQKLATALRTKGQALEAAESSARSKLIEARLHLIRRNDLARCADCVAQGEPILITHAGINLRISLLPRGAADPDPFFAQKLETSSKNPWGVVPGTRVTALELLLPESHQGLGFISLREGSLPSGPVRLEVSGRPSLEVMRARVRLSDGSVRDISLESGIQEAGLRPVLDREAMVYRGFSGCHTQACWDAAVAIYRDKLIDRAGLGPRTFRTENLELADGSPFEIQQVAYSWDGAGNVLIPRSEGTLVKSVIQCSPATLLKIESAIARAMAPRLHEFVRNASGYRVEIPLRDGSMLKIRFYVKEDGSIATWYVDLPRKREGSAFLFPGLDRLLKNLEAFAHLRFLNDQGGAETDYGRSGGFGQKSAVFQIQAELIGLFHIGKIKDYRV